MKKLLSTFAILVGIGGGAAAIDSKADLKLRNKREVSLAKLENVSLPVFELLADFKSIQDAYSLQSIQDDLLEVRAASKYVLVLPQGRIVLTEWNGQLHEVNYQTPQSDNDKRIRKLKYLFSEYGGKHRWAEIADNGFGKFFERSDNLVFGAWAYPNDTISFVSHELRSQENQAK